jgi:hypothetical protein
MRSAFTRDMPPGRMVSSISSTLAPAASSQAGKASFNERKARLEFTSLVFWESMV